MIQLRKSEERGHFDHGWLKTFHTFSFAHYHDARHMGFRALRVINEDYIKADEGFGTHGHRDMEILTYILTGALEHKDSMGNGSVIKPGEVQYMSAGRGVTHSEFNHSKSETSHLMQIWILPNEKSAEPRYDQKHFTREEKIGQWKLLASPDGAEDSIAIRQDVKLFAAILPANTELERSLSLTRFGWMQVVRGEIALNGLALRTGDAAGLAEETKILVKAGATETELLFFDLN